MQQRDIQDEAHEQTTLLIAAQSNRLNPDFLLQRNLSLENAVYNLIGTIVGGGLLSLPDAVSHAGIIPSTLMMIFSAGISVFSMRLFCYCAHQCGSNTSYNHIIRAAFGKKVEWVASIFYSFFLCLVLVGYMMLIKEIWTPLFYYLIPWLSLQRQSITSDYFLLLFLICLFPLLLKDDLLSLRHANYASFLALVVLVISMAYTLCRTYYAGSVDRKTIKWYSSDMSDWVYAFPIIGISFFCISNLLPVYQQLIQPTQERIHWVLNTSVGICVILFYIIAISGYLYATDETRDNILLNFDIHFDLITLGRLGFGLMLILILPLNMLPCRQALLNLPILFQHLSQDDGDDDNHDNDDEYLVSSLEFISENDPQPKEGEKGKENKEKEEKEEEPESFGTKSVTFIILVFCYTLSVVVPGVGILWAFCGSSSSLIFGFFLPCLCYLKLCDDGVHDRFQSYSAIFVAVFSLLTSFVCTVQIFYPINKNVPRYVFDQRLFFDCTYLDELGWTQYIYTL